MTPDRIPVVDIADAAAATGAIESACHEIGFMYLLGHGISPTLIAAMRSAVAAYFALPLEVKLADQILRDNYRGYIPAGFFSANSGAAVADLYEGYKLHYEVAANDPVCAACDLYGPNRWPREPAGLRRVVLDYWRECDRIATSLLHYPPQSPDRQGFGIHPHKDTDALTILAPDPVGGLFVRRRDAAGWIKAAAPDNALIVNIGDLLELWSGGYLVSTPHKVVNSSGAERYSFPYFVVPRFDTVVRPFKSPPADFHRCSVHVGDVSREVWRTNWPDTQPENPDFDLGTLQD